MQRELILHRIEKFKKLQSMISCLGSCHLDLGSNVERGFFQAPGTEQQSALRGFPETFRKSLEGLWQLVFLQITRIPLQGLLGFGKQLRNAVGRAGLEKLIRRCVPIEQGKKRGNIKDWGDFWAASNALVPLFPRPVVNPANRHVPRRPQIR